MAVDLTPLNGMLDMLATLLKDANEKGAAVKEMKSGKNDAVANLVNTSDDETLSRFRSWVKDIDTKIAELTAKRDEQKKKVLDYAETLLAESGNGKTLEESTEDFRKAREAANNTKKAIETLVVNNLGGTTEDVREAMRARDVEYEIVSLSGAKAGGSTGQKRPRLSEAYINGEPAPAGASGVPSFTTIAQHISKHFGPVKADDLKTAAFAAAGTDDLSTVESVEFVYVLPKVLFENVNADVTVKVVPKAAAEGEAEESETDSEE